MLCVQTDSSGFVQVVSPQPVDISSCAMVITSAAEVGASPFSLTQADAEAIGSSIVFLWGIGFAARAVIRALGSSSSNEVFQNE